MLRYAQHDMALGCLSISTSLSRFRRRDAKYCVFTAAFAAETQDVASLPKPTIYNPKPKL